MPWRLRSLLLAAASWCNPSLDYKNGSVALPYPMLSRGVMRHIPSLYLLQAQRFMQNVVRRGQVTLLPYTDAILIDWACRGGGSGSDDVRC